MQKELLAKGTIWDIDILRKEPPPKLKNLLTHLFAGLVICHYLKRNVQLKLNLIIIEIAVILLTDFKNRGFLIRKSINVIINNWSYPIDSDS